VSLNSDLVGAVRTLVEELRDGDYFAITAYIEANPYAEQVFADMRADVRNSRAVATTLGYGPRFLHSTGQLHKGGPPRGVFLQVTARDREDIGVPGRPFTFGQLKRAQAIGDFQSLVGHGRPVRRVHLAGDIESGLEEVRAAVRGATRAAAKAGG
jgi:hypothetical protein